MALNNDDIKALIAILQKGLEHSETEEEPDNTPVVKKTKSGKKSRSSSSGKKNINKFDNMPEINMHKEDIAIDKKLTRSLSPTPRREAFKPIEVSCRVCHRTDMVDPSIIESIDRYKCNKCAISAG
ncbi:hypothetical protein EB118_21380 [bacterium]|nr:hypothetical protein [bacterium]NDC95157.1 hypothetical protein [bacterium]NDG32611.1 hypothetical protein [bacterium]